ncbi:MAG: GH25 family lysozyme [Oscillospiraceae bacterium]
MAVKNYPCSDNTQLSEHFNVKEFRCKCCQNHDILIADELIDKLEKLFEKLDCSKIIVTSGHRCSVHDRAVGGSGVGQHINGNAADICCYGQDGQPISSKLVCCAAQDIGFGGIANITSAYIYTHVDVRTSNIWFGDETVNYHTLTNDFYQYFDISRNSDTTKEDNSMAMKGIDVSKHNGSINWNQVKADGVRFAILRAGYGRLASQKDVKFEEYYSGAKAVGIPIGCYWYSYATSVEEAKIEAQVCISVIKGKQFEFPIYFDLEEQKAFNTGKANCSAMVRAFCGELEKAGYWAGLYMSRSPFNSYMEEDIKTRYALWLAEYNSKLNYSGSVGMWQKSSTGRIAGISGNVDIDEGYIDYAEKVKSAGLNGFSKTKTISTPTAPIITATELTENSVTVEVKVNGETYSGKLNKKQ